jgi:ectoine hydroxylase-related dioxygenase (phytanoyl-CoA dioxygenase family)
VVLECDVAFHRPGGLSPEAGELVEDYTRNGFAIVRGFFSPSEVRTIAAAIDRVHAEGVAHGRSFRHGNLFYNVAPGPDPLVRMAQWFAYHQPVLNAVRLDTRFVDLLEPLIGRDLKQIINQIHWKEPGAKSDFAWHQDARFRRPAEAYRNLATSYVQTGLAIDPHTPASGCMRMVPGSHRRGTIDLDCSREVLGTAMDDGALIAAGLSPDSVVDLVLEPGDLALWSPFLVHASGENGEDHRRRLYINGYVRAADCDRGEWAFRDAEPVPFGPEPALVHYEQLRERGEPHYV